MSVHWGFVMVFNLHVQSDNCILFPYFCQNTPSRSCIGSQEQLFMYFRPVWIYANSDLGHFTTWSENILSRWRRERRKKMWMRLMMITMMMTMIIIFGMLYAFPLFHFFVFSFFLFNLLFPLNSFIYAWSTKTFTENFIGFYIENLGVQKYKFHFISPYYI